MKTLDLKLTRIGNSRGIRLPVALIKRYGFSGTLAAEVRVEGLLLKPKRPTKLSWEETAQAMAASEEDCRGDALLIVARAFGINVSPIRGDMSIADGVEINLSPVRGGMFIEPMPKTTCLIPQACLQNPARTNVQGRQGAKDKP
ncbi:MAG: AbrB/MazE/SpoVT family DNA-binding domain-containing protein [Verrucomicrobiota bacterium]